MDIKLDTVNETSTAKAVVIGCSHSNSDCEHKMHPSKDAFFTIDIMPKIEPDLCMDITKEAVPDALKNKFYLTILEFLPFDVYNLNKVSRAYMKIDGSIGWQHIKELTHDDGFIMVVGNAPNFCYRSSFANLKFLELAHSEDFKNTVVLIPKNQNLTALEVKEQIAQLPQELQDSIQCASTQGFIPSQAYDFCQLNYVPSEINAELIDNLNQFRCMAQCIPDFHLHEGLLNGIHAADALIDVLLGNAAESSLAAHQDALNSGPLEEIITITLNGKSLGELIDKGDKTESFNDFKDKYADIKQQRLAENVDPSFYPGIS